MNAPISSVSMTTCMVEREGSIEANILTLSSTGDRFITLKQPGLTIILDGVEREAAANARQIAFALKAVAEELEWTLAKPVPEAAVQS